MTVPQPLRWLRKYLARSDAQTVGLFGTGRLAGPQLKALKAVRPIKRWWDIQQKPCVKTGIRRRDVEGARDRSPRGRLLEDAARDVDIILTITNTTTPVVKGAWLTAPCLVLGIGANERYAA